MTISSIKVKVVRRPTLKLKVLPRFPANVVAANFVTLTRSGGTYTLGADYTVLTPGPIQDPTTAMIALLDQTAGVYKEVSLASLLTSGLDADLQAIAALTTTGILVRTASNTWVLRAVTGTANEITVTNGDGVAGAPTISLPSALTFTGKTVTGGTFNSPALVTPALGTPASGTMTNVTGLPVSTGVSGLAAGVATFLGTPSSANLRAALTDEVGTGAAYFVGGALGTPASGTATNLTGLPLSGLTTQGAFTIVANNTSGAAVPTAMDVTAITSKPAPVSADIVLIQDSAASNAFKRTTVGALASAGSVGSFNALTGAVTTSVVVQKLTASGTYTPTAGMLHCIIECVGGGGAGGGAAGSATGVKGGHGGNSGGYSRKYATAAAVGASQTVTIGAGGTAGTAGDNSGGAGGDTSVGTLCIAKGGPGGNSGPVDQAAGAVAGTGDVALPGNLGFPGYSATVITANPVMGGGAPSHLSGGAKGQIASNSAAGTAAIANSGAGGSGAAFNSSASTAAGGAGGSGIVIITEFVNL